jgi:hypothetical protein
MYVVEETAVLINWAICSSEGDDDDTDAKYLHFQHCLENPMNRPQIMKHQVNLTPLTLMLVKGLASLLFIATAVYVARGLRCCLSFDRRKGK